MSEHVDNGAGWCVGCPPRPENPDMLSVRSRYCPVNNPPHMVLANRLDDAMRELHDAMSREQDARVYLAQRERIVGIKRLAIGNVIRGAPMKALRVDVTPDEDGIVAVVHNLDVDKVMVHASASGEPRPVVGSNVISPNEVEVITTTDVTSVLITQWEDGE